MNNEGIKEGTPIHNTLNQFSQMKTQNNVRRKKENLKNKGKFNRMEIEEGKIYMIKDMMGDEGKHIRKENITNMQRDTHQSKGKVHCEDSNRNIHEAKNAMACNKINMLKAIPKKTKEDHHHNTSRNIHEEIHINKKNLEGKQNYN